MELIIVDESERLRPAALGLLRDRYDRDDIALILIGMPGLEKQFSHYPQFYSRVGFAHQYRPVGKDELLFVLRRHWRSLGKILDPEDFNDAHAIATLAASLAATSDCSNASPPRSSASSRSTKSTPSTTTSSKPPRALW